MHWSGVASINIFLPKHAQSKRNAMHLQHAMQHMVTCSEIADSLSPSLIMYFILTVVVESGSYVICLRFAYRVFLFELACYVFMPLLQF